MKFIHILIVEDEPPVADHIKSLIHTILDPSKVSIKLVYTFEDALSFLNNNIIDLCFLDLNLSGVSGFDILIQSVSKNFQTIIISAYTDQAIEAYNYGVLDFVPKPISKDRLINAFNRYFNKINDEFPRAKYIVTKKGYIHKIISTDEILFFKAEGHIVDVFLKNGRKEMIEKSLTCLEKILPTNFFRVHRSFIVDLNEISYYRHIGGSVYEICLKNDSRIPLGYSKYKQLKQLFKQKPI